MNFYDANTKALISEKEVCEKELEKIADKGISLDLSRGKPSPEQLSLSLPMLDVLDHRSILDSENGMDCRNYGGPDGIPEARRLLAHMMGTHVVHTLVGGNSSLTLMYQLVSHGMTDGICGGTPWQDVKDRKFLCPVPGYDRHFAITEHFGFELIPIRMREDGPDMDEVEDGIKDPRVKGIWCVPKYQNPTGIVFSDAVVRRFARLKPAAADFRIFWDNAYCVHCFDGACAEIPDIIEECEKAGNADLVYAFCSTSKGSAGLLAHMKKHAAILKPRFDAVYRTLEKELGGTGIANWTTPKGGYFLSFNTLPGCAKDVVQMCAQYGVKFTPAGSTYPHGYDPEDQNIRLAPSFASVEEITEAIRVLCLCTKLVSIKTIMKARS